MKTDCDNCGNTIERIPAEIERTNTQFCDRECKHEYDRGADPVDCDNCGETIYRKPTKLKKNNNNFCSQECYGKHKSREKEVPCEYCGSPVTKKRSQIKYNDIHFCDPQCHGKYQRNKIQVPCDNCGEEIWKKPSVISEYENQFCNLECKNQYFTGERHPQYTEGKTDFHSTREAKQWRKEIFERDGYTCQECGKEGGVINAHHIEHVSESPKKRTDLDNGITLCIDCHASRHEEPEKSLILSQKP